MSCFLHLADLHLGAAFSAFAPDVAAGRRRAQLGALERLLQQAYAKGAAAFLFAGDVFDSPMPPRDIAKDFFGILARFPVPALFSPGNHDPLLAGGVWEMAKEQQNVHVFNSEDLAYFDIEALRLRVFGFGYRAGRADAPELSGAVCPDGYDAVLLAHTELGLPMSPYAPIMNASLAASRFVYAALGHIHRPPEPVLCDGTLAAYSGFFAGHGFDECGSGRALLVRIGEAPTEGELGFPGSAVRLLPLYTDAPRFEALTVDVEGAQDNGELAEKLQNALRLAAFSADTALRVYLQGQVGLACTTNAALFDAFGENYALFEVVDRTTPLLDTAYLAQDPTVRGAFYRVLLPDLTSADAQTRRTAADALRLGLAALDGRDVTI